MRAIDCGMAMCSDCHLLVKLPNNIPNEGSIICPRCGSEVHQRKPESIARTWALLIASIVFYIPANMLPMMHVVTFAGTQSDTIISGVIYFIQSGSYMIGLVILIASILVPVIKIFILIYLLISVQKRSCLKKSERQKLYILTEIVGRWSMVDVYVIAIMIALVHIEGLSVIKAGAGALFFLLVVIFTMLAAMSFDSRLIWDTKGGNAKE